MNILVDSIPTYYRDEGNGKVLLMLHGWGSDLTTFNAFSTWASDKYRVLRLDLPGFGKTPNKDDTGWNIDDYIEFIVEFLNKLEIDQLEVVFGHSMGGRIAIKGVSGGKLKSRRLVLLSSHGISEDTVRNSVWAVVAKTGKAATILLPESWRDGLRKRLYSVLGVNDYVSASKAQKATFKKIVSEDMQKDARAITIPTLIIYGSEDTDTPPRYGEYYNELIDNSKLWIIRGAGHYVHEQAFSKVTAKFREFMDS